MNIFNFRHFALIFKLFMRNISQINHPEKTNSICHQNPVIQGQNKEIYDLSSWPDLPLFNHDRPKSNFHFLVGLWDVKCLGIAKYHQC